MSSYIIVGDALICGQWEECLIYICGTKQNAEDVLKQMLENPNEDDLNKMKTHKNIRIKEVKDEDCWWTDQSNF